MGESALPARPLLKPWYRLSIRESAAVMRYGGSVLEFEGRAAVRLLPHLLPLLDGTRTVEEIVSNLGEPVRPAVVHALRMLTERQLLTEPMPEGRTVEFLVATDAYGRDAATVAAALARARISVVGSAATADKTATLLGESLDCIERAGFDDDLDVDLAVVAPAAHEVPLVRAWNERALERGTTWLQVLPFDGLIAAVGPIFVPRQTACHECYRLRRAANIAAIADYEEGTYPGAPAFDAVLAGLAATIALRRVALDDGRFVGVLLAVEELACTRHVLYRVPRCPVCSTAANVAAPAPWHALAEHAA